MNYGEKIRAFRTSKNMTQMELAKKMQVTRCRISHIESSENLNSATIEKVAKALEIEVVELLFGNIDK